HNIFRAVGIACPAIFQNPAAVPAHGQWLIKPLLGAGGQGIRLWQGEPIPERSQEQVYFQEYIEGDSCAAIYLGSGNAARLLGVSRQLVAESWLHATAFHYCGSIGPLALTPPLQQAFERLGNVLAAGCGLRGVFGVDCVLCDGVPWPVEVNPRYTASIEVLEYAAGFSAVGWQRSVFDPSAPEPPPLSA